MPGLAIDPSDIAPRDWHSHYLSVKKRIASAESFLSRQKSEEDAKIAQEKRAQEERDQQEKLRWQRDQENWVRRLSLFKGPIEYIEPEVPESRPLSNSIIRSVAEEYGFSPDELKGRRRNEKLCIARHAAIFRVAAERPDMSLPMIGRLFNRDHTTILHAIEKHARRQNIPPLIRQRIHKKEG